MDPIIFDTEMEACKLPTIAEGYADDNAKFNQGYDAANSGEPYDEDADEFVRMGWYWRMGDELRQQLAAMTKERDECRKLLKEEVDEWTRSYHNLAIGRNNILLERDEARAERDRLAAENEQLKQQAIEFNRVVANYGGWHEQFEREKEIALALAETEPSDRDTEEVAIADLLGIIDAMRGDLWKMEGEVEQLEQQLSRPAASEVKWTGTTAKCNGYDLNVWSSDDTDTFNWMLSISGLGCETKEEAKRAAESALRELLTGSDATVKESLTVQTEPTPVKPWWFRHVSGWYACIDNNLATTAVFYSDGYPMKATNPWTLVELIKKCTRLPDEPEAVRKWREEQEALAAAKAGKDGAK